MSNPQRYHYTFFSFPIKQPSLGELGNFGFEENVKRTIESFIYEDGYEFTHIIPIVRDGTTVSMLFAFRKPYAVS